MTSPPNGIKRLAVARVLVFLISLGLMFSSLGNIPFALAQDGPSPTDTPTTPSNDKPTLLVKLAAGLSQAEQDAAIAAGGGTEVATIGALRLHVVEVAAGTVDVALTAYRADPNVESADRDRTREVEAAPNDPAYTDQWALPAIGWDQAYAATAIAGHSTLAVLDTGVDASVADLNGVTLNGYSAIGGDAATDPHGHGTWVASIAAAADEQRRRHRRRGVRRCQRPSRSGVGGRRHGSGL